MKLVLLGDSHCRELANVFAELTSSITVYTVFVPLDITTITLHYRSKINIINAYNPDVILIHLGHNDLVYHPIHNVSPSNSSTVASNTITLANEVHQNHPNSTIYISAILPRTFTHKSRLTKPQVSSYNKMAKRHGQRIRTYSEIAGFYSFINKPMWSKISAAIEFSTYYHKDGLHLNHDGQTALVGEWIKILLPDLE
jgi:lysophospholipase L1-like esterase